MTIKTLASPTDEREKTALSNWPNEIRVVDQGRGLSVVFADGCAAMLSADVLRVASRSAEAKAVHAAGAAIVGVEAVGNYAIKLAFADGHRSGIYSWEVLHELASAI